MTLRRYAPLKKSLGTVTPTALRDELRAVDGGCVGPRIGMPDQCFGEPYPDHIRASRGMGMKSRTTRDNTALLCSVHHRLKTENGRTWRPRLLDYVAQRDGVPA